MSKEFLARAGRRYSSTRALTARMGSRRRRDRSRWPPLPRERGTARIAGGCRTPFSAGWRRGSRCQPAGDEVAAGGASPWPPPKEGEPQPRRQALPPPWEGASRRRRDGGGPAPARAVTAFSRGRSRPPRQPAGACPERGRVVRCRCRCLSLPSEEGRPAGCGAGRGPRARRRPFTPPAGIPPPARSRRGWAPAGSGRRGGCRPRPP